MIKSSSTDYDWTKEFAGLTFKDKRLEKRFFRIMDSFADEPSKSILGASGGRDQAKGTYRFLSNDSVSREEILKSVQRATIHKIEGLDNSTDILLLQDTTSVSYGMRTGIKEMGFYADSPQKGMNVHNCIAVTGNGVPIGLVDQSAATRAHRKTDKDHDKQKLRPIEEKESFRWIETLREVHGLEFPKDANVITVCDREGDFYELFAEAEELGEQFLVRLVQNRLTSDGTRLFNQLKDSEIKGTMTVRTCRKPQSGEPPRDVLMEYHYMEVAIKKPARRKEKDLPDELTLTVIYAHEKGQPDGLHWFLMTNVPVESPERIERFIKYYGHRWLIERFHYVLKSGCGIEKMQSRTFDKLLLLILLYSVTALQLLNMMYMGRLCPQLPADMFFEEAEWQTLYRAANKTRELPKDRYTIHEALRDLGILGGRKMAPSDGPPGAKALWEGLDKLKTLLNYAEFVRP